jgi:UDP-N-acetylmuramoylalanine--D-glutamate ligase
MGGSDKGEDFSVLNDLLKQNARKVYIIGATTEKMVAAYKDIVEYECFSDFENAVVKAYRDSKSGDNIVLSPACASYDMFKNFEHRGQTFKDIVRKIRNNEYEKI